jgi:NDP-sugar pyrophosphorylase family protein
MAAASLADTTRFGRLLFQEDGEVNAFIEKGLSGPGHINAGIFPFARQALEALPSGRPVSLEREIFPGLIGRGLRTLPLSGAFLDIATPESYAAAVAFFAAVGPSAAKTC